MIEEKQIRDMEPPILGLSTEEFITSSEVTGTTTKLP